MKILNLYAGLGGNRKLWENNHEITAIEIKPEIAKIYQDLYPNDKIIITDAHQYLLEHFEEFDFIWGSPPCPSHSRVRKNIAYNAGFVKAIYPDMKLYEEILLLDNYFKGKWVIENVISFYDPLIRPYKIQRHYFWSNIVLTKIKIPPDKIVNPDLDYLQKHHNINLDKYNITKEEKLLMLKNCVNPDLANHIFKMAFKEKQAIL